MEFTFIFFFPRSPGCRRARYRWSVVGRGEAGVRQLCVCGRCRLLQHVCGGIHTGSGHRTGRGGDSQPRCAGSTGG